ncbi:hypothetical protein RHMOL_Rhmol11G0283100 [Rhododendron molle]|uniref:Uncharacterized protein n=1 Tax=Rhododendron molle TaxID=49168 RepID=A0ACC0LXM0_RHOML|nr:hypothetical protein RHMOL_Rhmol11G0283100 [Rhododendron molle]
MALGHDSSSVEGVIGKGVFTAIGAVWLVVGDPARDFMLRSPARSLSCQLRLVGDVSPFLLFEIQSIPPSSVSDGSSQLEAAGVLCGFHPRWSCLSLLSVYYSCFLRLV